MPKIAFETSFLLYTQIPDSGVILPSESGFPFDSYTLI